MLMFHHKQQYGFTLIELVVFIVVLAVGLTGTVLVINQTVANAPKAMMHIRAMEIAQAYLDEISTKRFDENTGQGGLPVCDSPTPVAPITPCSNVMGPEGSETRNIFNDVDDYHGTNDSPPVDASGITNADYVGYGVQISISYAGNDLALANNRFAKRINLVITSPFGDQIPVSYYRTNF